MATPIGELKRAVRAALETYANVHRGSGHHSMATTRLYEEARNLVRKHLGLAKTDYEVVFCSPDAASALMARLKPGDCRCLSSADLGLAMGLRALAVHRWALAQLSPLRTGGGTARLLGALGGVGQIAGALRSRHAGRRQRDRICQGPGPRPTAWQRLFSPGADR